MGTSGDIAECHNGAGYVWRLVETRVLLNILRCTEYLNHAELSNPNQPLMYHVGYERPWSKE